MQARGHVAGQLGVVEVGVLVDEVVPEVGRVRRIVVQREVLAVQAHLGERRARVVVGVDLGLVPGAQHRQLPAPDDGDDAADQLVVGPGVVVAEVAVGVQLLEIEQEVGAVQLVDVAGVQLGHRHPGVPGAVGEQLRAAALIADFGREQVDGAAEGGHAELAGLPWSAVHHHRPDGRGREEGGRVVGRAVGVAPGDAVVGDVELAVLEAAQDGLGLAKARAVERRARHAGREVDDLGEVRSHRDELVDGLAVDDRLRLVGRGGRGPSSQDRGPACRNRQNQAQARAAKKPCEPHGLKPVARHR